MAARAIVVENGVVTNFIAVDPTRPLPAGAVLALPEDDNVGIGFTYHPGETPRFRDPAAEE